MLNKTYIYVGFAVFFFVLSVLLLGVNFMGWNEPIDDSEAMVQINLPVIDWDRYLNLSKHLE